MDYGIQPTGFVRKPLSVILNEIEQKMVTEFGPGVIQTPQSPLGQINALFADLVTELWEMAEDVYQSYDPEQAEGTRLEILGRLRLLNRAGLEDGDYARAITNAGTARVTLADLAQAVTNVPGVTFRQVFVNESSVNDENNMPPNTVAVAVLGGDDVEVASAVNRFVPVGISSHGNTLVSILEDGYCRTVKLIRPVETSVSLEIRVRTGASRQGCPPPAAAAVGNALLAYLTAPNTRPANGQSITPFLVRSFIEASFEGVEFVSMVGIKAEFPDLLSGIIPMEFFEIAVVADIAIVVVNG